MGTRPPSHTPHTRFTGRWHGVQQPGAAVQAAATSKKQRGRCSHGAAQHSNTTSNRHDTGSRTVNGAAHTRGHTPLGAARTCTHIQTHKQDTRQRRLGRAYTALGHAASVSYRGTRGTTRVRHTAHCCAGHHHDNNTPGPMPPSGAAYTPDGVPSLQPTQQTDLTRHCTDTRTATSHP